MQTFWIACAAVLLSCVGVVGQEKSLERSPADAAAEGAFESIKVINASDWAHTISPSVQLQNDPCEYSDQNTVDTDGTATASGDSVEPDTSEYLIRFQSAKPVQEAFQRLVDLGLPGYGREQDPLSPADRPTELKAQHEGSHYNVADMITIAVILKHVGSDGTSLFDYGFSDNGRVFPSRSFRVFRCTTLTTSNGEEPAHVAWPISDSPDLKSAALELSFPRLVDGKPLISHERENVDFRMLVGHHVFASTFVINARDVLDGSERQLYLPAAFAELPETSQ